MRSKIKNTIFGLLFVLAFAMTLNAFVFTAGAVENVVFVKDGGNGDGTSAESPLKIEAYDIKNVGDAGRPLNNALYQAVNKLKNTGGTVVVCGKIEVKDEHLSGADVILPLNDGKTITITSVYNGVDYRRSSGAKIELYGNISARGDLVWENITLSAKRSGVKISCEGYEGYFGNGIICERYGDSSDGYPILVGGARYRHIYGKDAKMTVLSGTYTSIVGGSYGASAETQDDYPYGTMLGDVYLYVGGTTEITGDLYCSTISNIAPFMGNAYVTLDGCSILGRVVGTGSKGVIGHDYVVYIDVNGSGKFDSATFLGNGISGQSYDTPKAILDLSDYTGGLNAFTNADKFDAVIYPDRMISEVTLKSEPHKKDYYSGAEMDLAGAVFEVSYNNRGNEFNAEYTYEQCMKIINAGKAEEGMTQAKVFFGSYENPLSFAVNVKKSPEITLEGAQIKTLGREQGLRFVARLEKTGELEITEYGVLIVPSDYISQDQRIRFGSIYGMIQADATGKALRETDSYILFGGSVNRIPEEEYAFSYSAVAYYKYKDENGSGVVYSEVMTRSVYDVALKAAGSSSFENPSNMVRISDDVLYTVENNITYVRPEAIRQKMQNKVTDYMKSLGEIRWTNKIKMDFTTGPIEYTAPVYQANTLFKGLIYNGGKSTLEEWEYDLNDKNTYDDAQKTDYNKITGTSCSHSIFAAWQLVCNGFSMSGASKCSPAWDYGTIGVGEYNYHENFATTEAIIKSSGANIREYEQAMFNAYALLEPGDVLLKWWLNNNGVTLGHTIMPCSKPVIEYNANGTMSGNKSYIMIHEQQNSLLKGDGYYTTWRINYKMTFSDLLSQYFIPLSIEPMRTGYSATPYCLLSDASTAEEIVESGIRGRLDSNYRIRWYTIIITDESGREVFNESFFPYETQSCKIDEICTKDSISALSKGMYKYTLKVAYAENDEILVNMEFEKNK